MHAAILQFRNKLVDAHPRGSFEDVQRRVRWRYQWLAINDVIPGICGADVVKKLLPHCGRKEPAWKNKPTLN